LRQFQASDVIEKRLGRITLQNEPRQLIRRLHDGPAKPGRAHNRQNQDPQWYKWRHFNAILFNKIKDLSHFLAKKSRIPANPQINCASASRFKSRQKRHGQTVVTVPGHGLS
jgi:hypothetical protein